MPPRSYTSDAGQGESVSTEGLSFTLDGVTFDCHGEFDTNDLTDIATALMDADDGWVDPQALGAIGQLMQTMLGPATAKAFRRHRREHRTHPEVVSQIMLDLIEDITKRDPTRHSASPPGPPAPAGPSSPAASPSPASPRKRRAATVAARSRTARATMAAQAPGGIIPPEWAGSGDVITVPGPAGTPQEEPPMRRVVNMGDKSRTRAEPLAG